MSKAAPAVHPSPAGDFTSAALSTDNQQAAGSGGPFDPANTAKAHMTQHQTLESQSAGLPTTGGMTPKLDPNNMAHLSERDREAAQAVHNAKSDADKVSASNMSVSGRVTRGSADAIVNAKPEGDPMRPPEGAATEPPTRGSGTAIGFAPANEEADRTAREARLHDEAVEKSKETTAARKKDSGLTDPAAQRDHAAKALADGQKADEARHAAAVKKAPPPAAKKPAAKKVVAKAAKKVPAKKAAKKSKR